MSFLDMYFLTYPFLDTSTNKDTAYLTNNRSKYLRNFSKNWQNLKAMGIFWDAISNPGDCITYL